MRRAVLCLGASQLICWGISYYLIGVFGDLIVADTGWSRAAVHAGFSVALVVMGLTSPLAGRLIDRRGGRAVMVAGSVVLAAGCAALALARWLAVYEAAWVVVGIGMRLTLYDAAFAALARAGGPAAARPIAQITLLGGLASTVMWPTGHALAAHFGWRGAVLCYAGLALATVPLHLAIPTGRYDERREPGAPPARPALAASPRDRMLAATLYAVIVTLTSALNSGMSAHMISIVADLGVAAPVAVWISTLRGVGQAGARGAEVLSGGRVHPLALNLGALALLPPCFLAGLLGGRFVWAAVIFAFGYGAGNGIATITRGTLPLVLFDPRSYGALVGRLLLPSFLVSALAPLGYALVIDRFGAAGALLLSTGIAATSFAAGLWLAARFRRER